MIVGVVSGHFDPLHKGHVNHFKLGKSLCDVLIVIVNSDAQIKAKYGYVLQPLHKRIERMFRKAPFVDGVVVSIDNDRTQAQTLRLLRANKFFKGGDRDKGNMPQSELDACHDVGCEIVYGVGGQLASSTAIRKRIERLGMRDNRRRSLVKAVGYKGGSIALLALLSWVFTKDLLQMSLITVTYEGIAILGYFVYERLWERVKWGRNG